jgi:hypothetical protein
MRLQGTLSIPTVGLGCLCTRAAVQEWAHSACAVHALSMCGAQRLQVQPLQGLKGLQGLRCSLSRDTEQSEETGPKVRREMARCEALVRRMSSTPTSTTTPTSTSPTSTPTTTPTSRARSSAGCVYFYYY